MTSPERPAVHGGPHEGDRPPVQPGPGLRWSGDGSLAPGRSPRWGTEVAAASPIDLARRRPAPGGTAEGAAGLAAGVVLATVRRRLVCWLVDRALKAVIFVLILAVAGVGVANTPWPPSELVVAFSLLSAGYDFLFGIHGVTPAAFVMHIRIVRVDGAEPGVRRSLIRASAAVLNEGVFFAGALIALIDARRQTIHDKLAGTIVIDSSQPPPPHDHRP